jgi:hypothetical protein
MSIINGVIGQLDALQPCEHLADGSSTEAVWIATEPYQLLCCWGAAQVLATEHRCTACRQPAEQHQDGSTVVSEVDDTLALHFWMCSSCADSDGVPRAQTS